MDIDQFNSAVNYVKREVISEDPKRRARIALSGLGLIHDRILNEGLRGKKYSTNSLPTYFFTGKGLSDGADKKLAAEKKKQQKAGIDKPTISYSTWRDFNGLQTDHVDLRFSGEMWRDMAVLETNSTGLKLTTTVGSKNSITYIGGKKTGDIVGYLGDQYGDFLTPTDQEEKILDIALDEELDNIFNNYFK